MLVRDLPDSGNGRGVLMVCSNAGILHGEYSADRGDYFMADPQKVLRCSACNALMELVRKVTRYEKIGSRPEPEPQPAPKAVRIPAVLTCEMTHGCKGTVTHVDDRGFTYCQPHGVQRRASGTRCRKLTVAERRRLENGETIAYRKI